MSRGEFGPKPLLVVHLPFRDCPAWLRLQAARGCDVATKCPPADPQHPRLEVQLKPHRAPADSPERWQVFRCPDSLLPPHVSPVLHPITAQRGSPQSRPGSVRSCFFQGLLLEPQTPLSCLYFGLRHDFDEVLFIP